MIQRWSVPFRRHPERKEEDPCSSSHRTPSSSLTPLVPDLARTQPLKFEIEIELNARYNRVFAMWARERGMTETERGRDLFLWVLQLHTTDHKTTQLGNPHRNFHQISKIGLLIIFFLVKLIIIFFCKYLYMEAHLRWFADYAISPSPICSNDNFAAKLIYFNSTKKRKNSFILKKKWCFVQTKRRRRRKWNEWMRTEKWKFLIWVGWRKGEERK